MNIHNRRQKLTYGELKRRGDLEAIDQQQLGLEIQADGVAWITFEGCDLCYHLGKGWLPTADLTTLTEGHLDLAAALATVQRYPRS